MRVALRTVLGLAVALALVVAGCEGDSNSPTVAPPGGGESQLPTPGESGTAGPRVSSPPQTVAEGPSDAPGPVVDLFYAIHVHSQREWAPFLGPDLAELDPVAAEGFRSQVSGIAETLEEHGARGSFHFTFGTAAGLCEHDPALFDGLEAAGHEIGIHAHSDEFLPMAAEAMLTRCGRPIATGSGLAAMAGGPDGSTLQTLGTSLQVFVDVGATRLMVNLSGTCGGASTGGNILQPWRAGPDDVCTADPTGLVMIDQASLEYVVEDGAIADVFSLREFSTLADLAEAALSEAASLPSSETVVWGFVTHTTEYVPRNDPHGPPEQIALDGLGSLLERLEPYVAAGRARWSTAAEIAVRVP